MRLNILFLTLVILTGLTVLGADVGHSENVCSATDVKICGHIGHMTGMKPNQVSSFMAHLEVPKKVQISDVQITLQMPEMGHGSSAPVVKTVTPTKFKVTRAVFTMAGHWQVEIKFKADGADHQINVPIKIIP